MASRRPDPRRVAGALRRTQGIIGARFSHALESFWAEQADRVIERFLGEKAARKATVAELLPDGEDRLLVRAARPYILELTIQAAKLTAGLVGVPELTGRDPALERLLARSATRVVRVNRSTRDAIRTALRLGAEQGFSPFEIARGSTATREAGFRPLDEIVRETYRGRADAIARTEMATASQETAHDRYAEAGVERVEISDGASCGWEEHDSPDVADGSTRTLSEAEAFPIAHPNAVMAGTVVESIGEIEVAYRARWIGPLISIRTAGAARLAIGPNHPMLTGRGWVAAKSLRVGDDVFRRSNQRATGLGLDGNNVPASIEQIFETLRQAGTVTRAIPAPDDFHGDGNFCKGEVEIVDVDRMLARIPAGSYVQLECERIFERAGMQLQPFAGVRSRHLGGIAIMLTAPGYMCCGDPVRTASSPNRRELQFEGFPLCSYRPAEFAEDPTLIGIGCPTSDIAVIDRLPAFGHRIAQRLAAGANMPASPVENLTQDFRIAPREAGDLLKTLTSFVEPVRIIELGGGHFTGHAFDLQTSEHAYFAEGVLVSNCVRVSIPIIPRS